jgi:GNAT superfamily N-acetyltransferase
MRIISAKSDMSNNNANPRIRPLTARDLALGMRLKEQAGWNQTEADWRRLLDLQPDGGFVAELDGTPVGTLTTCLFGPVAWVAMVLVVAAVRGRGIGSALVAEALAFLENRGVHSVRLDATPLGRPVYEKYGFAAEYTLARYDGSLPPAGDVIPNVGPARPEEFPELFQIDRAVTGTDRRKFLERLFTEQPDAVRVVRERGCCTAFLAARPGTNALQIGPCVGPGEAAARLFAEAGHRYAGRRVFIDIPEQNRQAARQAEQLGLAPARHLLRMGRGEPVVERIAELWASSGPEKG